MLFNSFRHIQMGRRVHTIWVRDRIGRKSQIGVNAQLLDELRCEDTVSLKNTMRIDPIICFRKLLIYLQKKDTWYRKSLSVGLKVAIPLRHLATADRYVFIWGAAQQYMQSCITSP